MHLLAALLELLTLAVAVEEEEVVEILIKQVVMVALE